MKRIAPVKAKIVAGAAFVVLTVANPITSNGGIAFPASIPVLLVCFARWLLLGLSPRGDWPRTSQE